jgi:hypothetical protein
MSLQNGGIYRTVSMAHNLQLDHHHPHVSEQFKLLQCSSTFQSERPDTNLYVFRTVISETKQSNGRTNVVTVLTITPYKLLQRALYIYEFHTTFVHTKLGTLLAEETHDTRTADCVPLYEESIKFGSLIFSRVQNNSNASLRLPLHTGTEIPSFRMCRRLNTS